MQSKARLLMVPPVDSKTAPAGPAGG